ncbi:MAG: peptidase domain-containing ABC transporter [Geminicoccaceae bacterium]
MLAVAGPEVSAGPAPTAAAAQADAVLAGFMRLCEQLDRPLAEPEARGLVPLPDGPADPGTLVRLAERIGLSARLRGAGAGTLARLPVPFLLLGKQAGTAWWVRGRAGTHLVLVEPLTGATAARPVAEAARLGRQALVLSRAAQTGSRRILHRAILHRLRRPLLEIALASVMVNLLALATPLFMMTVYNKVIGHGALRTLDVLAVGMLSLLGFELLLRGLRGYIASHTGARLDALIGSEVVHHILRLPYRVFESMPAGQLTERLRQLDQVRQFLTGGLPLLAVDLAFVGLFVIALFALSPAMALLTLGAMPLFLGLSLLAARHQAGLGQLGFRAAAAKTACLAEAVSQAMTVKALGLEAEMERRFDRRLGESALAGFRAGNVASLVGGAGQALQQLTALVLVYVGARMVVAGDLSVGALVACNILAARALAPVRQLFGAWQQVQQAVDAFRRLDGLLGERPEPVAATAPRDLRPHLCFEQVGFRYAADRPPALADVSVEVAPGTLFAVVGPPGSGKSTFVRLLLGLDRPDTGRVTLDGVEVGRLRAGDWRSLVGVVPQDVQLFEGSIAENIALGMADRSAERIVAAARFVGLHEFVQRLPDGYDTRLGERGSGLSLGQRQLVALARAVVRSPRLLVLDEATSALDAATEAQLLTNLRRAGAGRTVVLVTHRLGLLALCDRAMLLQHGRVAAVGPAAEIAAGLQARAARPGLHAVR